MAQAGVTCSDCHEPHSLALREEGNTLCAGCHRAEVYDVPAHHHHPPGSEAARCVTCHMPETVFMGVDARREHAFRVPRPDLAAARDAPDVCTGCHAPRDRAWAARAIASWFGGERPASWRFPEALASAWALRADAAPLLLQLLDDAREPAIARATAARLLADFLDPGTAGALERALHDPDAMVRMAAAESAAGLPPALRAEWLRGLLADPVRSVRLAAARSLAGVELPPDRDAADLARALDELRDAASRNADRPEAHLDLAILATRQGDLDVARREAELALAIDPGLVPAAVNLADALRASGRDDLAESVLRDASKRNPESPDLHYALGLLHVRRGRPEAAHAALARAADLADDGRFAYPLGLLLVEEERTDEGLRVLADALAQRPGDRQLLVALATLHRDRGEREAALRYARRLLEAAPGDPGAAQLVESLER
jgi:predicted CXXCH cytochrome family protein